MANSIEKMRRKISELQVRRHPLPTYDNIFTVSPYKPPLTVLERTQFLPVARKPLGAGTTGSGKKKICILGPGEGFLHLVTAYHGARSEEAVLITDSAKIQAEQSRAGHAWQAYDLSWMSIEKAIMLVKCIPTELRPYVEPLSVFVDDLSPDILYGAGLYDSFIAFWVGIITRTPQIVLNCDDMALQYAEERVPAWFKEQLTFLIQQRNVFFTASDEGAFSKLQEHVKSQRESARFSDRACSRIVKTFEELESFLNNSNYNPAPQFPKLALAAKPFEIAVMPDDGFSHNIDQRNSFSYDMINYFLEKGHKVKLVDVYAKDVLSQIAGCDGFLWRWAHLDGQYHIAQRILPVIEKELGIPVFPDRATCWHYDDKVTQEYLFEAHDIPRPQTWIWYDRDRALRWLREEAVFPLVAKLTSGAASTNVFLMKSLQEAEKWVYIIFDQGVFEAEPSNKDFGKLLYRTCKDFIYRLNTGFPDVPKDGLYTFHRGYVLFQKFLTGNTFDTRANIIGDRCFVFRRYTRPDDFRASGSGLIDYDQASIDQEFIHLAFKTARALRMQSVAIDGMYDDGRVVLGEVSYTYMAYPLFACGGYWQLNGEPFKGTLRFVSEPLWPGRAIAEDFLRRLEAKK